MTHFQKFSASPRRPSARFLTVCALPLSLALALTSAASAMAQANPQHLQDWQSVDAMTQNIARALGREAAPIDPRIKLAQCPEKPEVTAMNANALAVRCASLGWRLRVAMLGANSRAMGNDFSEIYAASAQKQPRQRSEPPTIRRGDAVRVSIETTSYSVSYSAIATQEGRIGEAISLRGADPKNPIIAVVSGPGTASISRQ